MKDIDAIVERFMEAEDANFSLFSYVNEVHAEVEKLEEQIADIKVCMIHLSGFVSRCGVLRGQDLGWGLWVGVASWEGYKSLGGWVSLVGGWACCAGFGQVQGWGRCRVRAGVRCRVWAGVGLC